MIHSMTAYASRNGTSGPTSWTWELRGVNARGLDLRLRLPDGLDGLEQIVRAALTSRLSRGNVNLTLKLQRDDLTDGLQIDEAHLDRVLIALEQVQTRAFAAGVTLAQATAADVLGHRGVVVQSKPDPDPGAVIAALTADLGPLLDDFTAMRRTEGAALSKILDDQLSLISALTDQAAQAALDRRKDADLAFQASVRRVLDSAPDIDADRLAQELAILAVKSDVTEEIDRLRAHVVAARALMADPAASGRKLDFLAQEFNREANTLCSKAQSTALTAIGLDLKAVIDQLREQIQNVE